MGFDPIPTFEQELRHLINCHSVENESNTPDFVLADYIRDCLNAFTKATAGRDSYYGMRATGCSMQRADEEGLDISEAARRNPQIIRDEIDREIIKDLKDPDPAS